MNSHQREEELSPVTIRGILYLMRKEVGIENMPTKSAFYSAVARVEEQFGIPRGRLQVITEPKINLITRFGESPILEVRPERVSHALALLYMEKSTIIKAIELDGSLTDRGIHIVKAMGFSTRDVNKVIAVARETGLLILTLTDLDPSGLLIDKHIARHVETHRLGIDLDLVKGLGLAIEDVREPLPRDPKKLNHLKALTPEEQRIFTHGIGDGEHPYRIEIDGVFALAGKGRFMSAILERADTILPTKPVARILAPRRVPRKVEDLRSQLHELIDRKFSDLLRDQVAKFERHEMPLKDIRLSEIEELIEDTLDREGETDEVCRILKGLISKFP